MTLDSLFRSTVISIVCLLCVNQVIAQSAIALQWKDDKAIAITVPVSIIDHYSKDPDSDLFFKVFLEGEETALLGKIDRESDDLIFKPAWAFTQGMTYEVFWKKKRVGKFSVPVRDAGPGPSLVIYPADDTLPANLLKMYFQFSQPMQEEDVYKFITVIKNDRDTVPVFLNLQPALWNEDQTRLTLWLDPGRIKRDLGPNRVLGKPLEEGNRYRLLVSSRWKNKRGALLVTDYKKTFYASADDRTIPDPKKWKITPPHANTHESLVIDFTEPLDYSLSTDAIYVIRDHLPVKGTVTLNRDERQWNFTCEGDWIPGKYIIKIESRLEDLAGNNLNRPFDKDLINDNSPHQEFPHHTLEFQVTAK